MAELNFADVPQVQQTISALGIHRIAAGMSIDPWTVREWARTGIVPLGDRFAFQAYIDRRATEAPLPEPDTSIGETRFLKAAQKPKGQGAKSLTLKQAQREGRIAEFAEQEQARLDQAAPEPETPALTLPSTPKPKEPKMAKKTSTRQSHIAKHFPGTKRVTCYLTDEAIEALTVASVKKHGLANLTRNVAVAASEILVEALAE